MKNKSTSFWNNSINTNYFANKPPDWRILERLHDIPSVKRKKMNALDLGSGGGRHTKILCKYGFLTKAIDANIEMVKKTKEVSSSIKREAEIFQGIMTEIPFPNDFFDVIIATGVLHQANNLKEYKKTIKEIARVAKNDCVLCLNIFTNLVLDNTYKKRGKYSYLTKEGLPMCLLDKEFFYTLMIENGFLLEKEYSEDIVQENTGERSVLRCNFIKKNSVINPNHNFNICFKNDILILGDNEVDCTKNFFVKKKYDFDNQKGFYQGNFEYTDLALQKTIIGTPESYGRSRIVKFLKEHAKQDDAILDLGSGCLNIYRELNDVIKAPNIPLYINLDISGPFKSDFGGTLTLGVKRVISKRIPTYCIESNMQNIKKVFKEESFDYIVSCMALHHTPSTYRKKIFLHIYKLLKPQGVFINMDFYLKDSNRNVFTEAGEKGPKECSGHGINFAEYLKLITRAGFYFYKKGDKIINSNGNVTKDYLKKTIHNCELSMPINKATYYTVLIKK